MAERITAWNPPHHLAFDVLTTPEPMFEMTPFLACAPPHLHETFTSEAGSSDSRRSRMGRLG